MALPRKYRLPLSQQNKRLLQKSGKKIYTGFATGYYLPADSLTGGRFAVVISSKLSKKATVRNRIRRLIHNAILTCLPKEVKIDMIVYPKQSVIGLDGDEIKKEVKFLLDKVV